MGWALMLFGARINLFCQRGNWMGGVTYYIFMQQSAACVQERRLHCIQTSLVPSEKPSLWSLESRKLLSGSQSTFLVGPSGLTRSPMLCRLWALFKQTPQSLQISELVMSLQRLQTLEVHTYTLKTLKHLPSCCEKSVPLEVNEVWQKLTSGFARELMAQAWQPLSWLPTQAILHETRHHYGPAATTPPNFLNSDSPVWAVWAVQVHVFAAWRHKVTSSHNSQPHYTNRLHQGIKRILLHQSSLSLHFISPGF